MKGHIRERSPGKWAIILDTRRPSDRQAQAPLALIPGQQAAGPD